MKAPFKFLDSYTQGDMEVFFGREKETENLYNALTGVKHLLVYGPSGAGKTSLIECGLRNHFSDADWFALTIRKGKNIVESVSTAINEVLKNKFEPNEALNFANLVESLFAEKYQPVYLLFDQFEELLILGEQEEKESFFKAINDLIRYKVPCRILFIMREEFIGHLSEFEYLCPTIFQNRFRLEKMNRNNVQQVIEEILNAPFYQDTFTVADSQLLAQKIIERLPDAQKEIELTHVQVFLSELWERAYEGQKGLPRLEDNLIKDSDKLETILDSFLKKQLTTMEAIFGKKIPLEVLALMISERHTKLQLTSKEIKDELQAKAVLLDELQIDKILNIFERSRILRKLGSEENIKYEITHDLLALAVGQNLTEDIKMRQKAVDIYAIYQDRKTLFSQAELDYIRPYQTYWDYPTELKQKIQESEIAIENEKNRVLAQALTAAKREKMLRENAEEQRLKAEAQRQRAETLRKRADELQQEAKRRSNIAILVAIIALIASVMAWWQYQKAETKSEEAQVAQKKAQATLDKIYFYDDKFGLAYDKNRGKYGFIDKNLKIKIHFKYEEAFSFDYDGWAKVKRDGILYLMDTTGTEYRLATDINHSNAKVTALDLSYTNLSKIPKAVFEQIQLKILLLKGNQISETKGLEKLNKLETLNFSNNRISKIEGLEKLTALKSLQFSHNKISKIEGLKKLTALQNFYIRNNSISKVEGLEELTALQKLYISDNKICKIEGLEKLTALQRLYISNSQISKIEGLEKLTALKRLSISGAKISKIEGLDNLKNLQYLNISSNQISKIEGLDKLSNLQTLYISSNRIRKEEKEKLKKILPKCSIY